MKITVIGTGYVGLVSGARRADVGNEVLCRDLDAAQACNLDDPAAPRKAGLEYFGIGRL